MCHDVGCGTGRSGVDVLEFAAGVRSDVGGVRRREGKVRPCDACPACLGPLSVLIGGHAAPAVEPRTPVIAPYSVTFTLDALAQPIPEPGAWPLMAPGLMAIGVASKRRAAGGLSAFNMAPARLDPPEYRVR